MEGSDELIAHITSGASVVYLLEWVKNSGMFPWVTCDSKKLNRALSLGMAAAVAIGINWTYDPTSGDLVIHGLTWASVLGAAYEWLKQFVMQQAAFDALVNKGSKGSKGNKGNKVAGTVAGTPHPFIIHP